MTFSRQEVTKAIGDGLLSFPITDFDSQGRFDEASYRKRLEWFISHEISAVFVAGGTGEFFNLSLDEYREIVRVAVEVIDGRLPVIASAGLSVETGKAFAKAAEESGADGILLMPPYLTECPQDGLVEYARQICDATSVNVIYYNRGNGILNAHSVQQLADHCPNLVGLKDGKGDIQALNKIVKTVGDRLVYIGGVPTAEIFAEAYVSIGVNTYSSAVFNFVPEMAVKFYKELRKGNKDVVKQIANDFFIPFVDLRDRKAGYAVSLIKAGADIVGRPAGSVRAPLTMPTQAECQELKKLIDRVK
ncbi:MULTISPECIES: 5-dehydro-4-deoxyglucarate dehydratase [Halomonadaceae]|uniref:5-dehydro-4-deoxyglucarate dehydratase n=1 Tax=Halomonadaceae TaxID=28256 RepID=UPI0012EF0EC0|nr:MULTISPECIES: 5-dehydro-4-deoxyglucarate dehydratase [Halomonas]CAD5273481.1 putative 5-dehydro-4-deoxyglucarate dehydratase [Halomonas sp. 156]CAD5277949.1 putative 5-dehydro-4-deoxyglucarate dehydratase [Halomonas sp. 113]CAD5279327.1 putative 5-dehydro-4-deoxyglucarate dehydratase [Halomonas sp. 59]CAD5285230.1 putative 5-dehydro-4-deoxyglucarate dehydratase [Halomonas sp. I3]VXB00364.1 putative 5-dehydro-4-deoxyglucarate dehydratase [Halomonas titanicae]